MWVFMWSGGTKSREQVMGKRSDGTDDLLWTCWCSRSAHAVPRWRMCQSSVKSLHLTKQLTHSISLPPIFLPPLPRSTFTSGLPALTHKCAREHDADDLSERPVMSAAGVPGWRCGSEETASCDYGNLLVRLWGVCVWAGMCRNTATCRVRWGK